MNKQMMFLALAVITSYLSLGQSIGIGTNSPHNSAILDINSNNKGMLTPRMTTAQRNVIAAPAKGLLLFDTDVNNFFYYNGTAWASFSGTGISFPYTTTVNTVTQGFGIINAGSGTGLYGAATIGNGVYGRADAAGGKGVTGFGLNGATGVLAYASPGLALEVNGNLKISGGNTNPSAGAVLTSDASGNAVWKTNKIAFSVFDNWKGGVNNYPEQTWFTMQFGVERYDYGNTISVGNGGSNSAFSAPVSGLYHFDASVYYLKTGIIVRMAFVKIKLNGLTEAIAYSESAETVEAASNVSGLGNSSQLSTDVTLLKGEKLVVRAAWSNGTKSASSITSLEPQVFTLGGFSSANYFNGYLVFED